MKKPYVLTFSVPANVLIRVPTTGTNHQDALANGHAAVGQWQGATADIESVDLEAATFVSMDNDTAGLAPPEPLCELPTSLWQVVLLHGGLVYSMSEPMGQSAAEARRAEALKNATAGYSHVALRSFGETSNLKADRVSRGGWEVWARPTADQPEELVEAWLSEAEAIALFRSLALSRAQAGLRLVNFSNRIEGPKEVRALLSSARGAS